jgi:hypothetical protein
MNKLSSLPTYNITLGGMVYEAKIVKEIYQANNATALYLYTPTGDDIVAVATTCLPDEKLEADETFLKTWAENEGIMEQLIALGVISEPLTYAQAGYVLVPKVKVLI